MQITSTHNLRRACHAISEDDNNTTNDRDKWEIIAILIEFERYESAARAWRLMDTASRDLLDQYARKDSNVKHEAEAVLSIQWRF